MLYIPRPACKTSPNPPNLPPKKTEVTRKPGLGIRMGRSAYSSTHQQRPYPIPVNSEPQRPLKRKAPRKPSVPEQRTPSIQERRQSRRSSQHMVTPGCAPWLPGAWSCYRAPCPSAPHCQPCYPPDYGLPRFPCLPRSPWPHYFHPIVVTT